MRLLLRSAVVAAAATAGSLLLGAPGAVAASPTVFAGNVSTSCSRPSAPNSGTATGNGFCDYVGTSTTCVTTVSVPEGSVVVPCVGNWDGTANLFFILVRPRESDSVQTFCAGSGNGIFHYKPTLSSPYQNIAITITVAGQTGRFDGTLVSGATTTAVHGEFTAACGGFGTYAGTVG
jgi:hypothetical protein